MNKKNSKAVVFYPTFFNLQGKRGMVVGGGEVALRKVKMLLDGGAKVTVISPRPHPEIVKLSKEKAIHLIQRDYEAGDLKDAVIAMVCTDKEKVNRKVADEAKKAGVLVNVADHSEPSDFRSFLFTKGEFDRCRFHLRGKSGPCQKNPDKS